jgi:hypothetical protein
MQYDPYCPEYDNYTSGENTSPPLGLFTYMCGDRLMILIYLYTYNVMCKKDEIVDKIVRRTESK